LTTNRIWPLWPILSKFAHNVTHVLQGVSTRITNTLATQALSSERPPSTRQTHVHFLLLFNLLHETHYNTELNTP
jgi:hypothetical protein